MNFNESIILNTYSDIANKQFDEMQSRLSKIDSSFQTRMNGKTTGSLVGSLIGTVAWLVALISCTIMLWDEVEEMLLIGALVVTLILIALMITDNIMNFSYYGKISAYRNSVSQLQNRVSIGKSSVKSNHDAFMESKANGWHYLLNAASSIPDEATSIEATITNMESLKMGFINGAKNVFYYATVAMITIVGCVALFPIGGEIINGISTADFYDDTLLIFNIIALVIVGIGEIILAKLVWSKTDCSVTNITLLVVAIGPIAFLALIALATLLVLLVVGIAYIAVIILGVVFVGAIAVGCLSGG